jgi:hypothetical protein
MPTDPYVPSEIGDRPRQQQNLPPGLALPPARDWRADRPGDEASAPGDPKPGDDGDAAPEAGTLMGRLMGRPGPNVGYAYTLAARVRSRLRLSVHEHAEDVIAVLAEIAGKRAGLFGRAPVIGDVDVAVELLGYDGTADESFVELRARLTHDAAHDYTRRRALVDAVPEDLLRLRGTALSERVAEWRAQARLDLSPHPA